MHYHVSQAQSFLRGHALSAFLWFGSSFGVCACSQQDYSVSDVSVHEQPIFALELTTDLSIPSDIDSLRIEFIDPQSFDAQLFAKDDELGDAGLLLRARFWAPVPSDTTETQMTYRVKAWKGSKLEIFAEGIVTLPTRDSFVVVQPLERSCYGWVAASDAGEPGSSCPSGQVCRAGACVSIDRTQEHFPVIAADGTLVDAGS